MNIMTKICPQLSMREMYTKQICTQSDTECRPENTLTIGRK